MLKQEDGAITIFILSIFLALMILVGGVIEMINSQFTLLDKQADNLQALYLAESGMEQAIVNIKTGEFNSFKEEVIIAKRYSGSYEVDIISKGDKYQVISTGNFQDKKRVLRRVIDK